MAVDLTRTNNACLRMFGQAFMLTRLADGAQVAFDAIILDPDQGEDAAPGAGSANLFLWTTAAGIDPAPERGDEVTADRYVYKLLEAPKDAGGGMTLQLRKDRELD